MVQEGLCATQDDFVSQGTKMSVKRKKCENKQWPQDKGDVKTEGVKSNIFNRKRSQNKSVKQQETRKTVPSENRVKRMRCGEKKMSREEGLKKTRCPKLRMPRERDVNGKRLKRHRFQETAMTSEKACQERRVCQVSGFKKCQEQAASDRCREQEMSRTKTSKRSRSRRPCQPGSQALFL